MVMEWGFFSFLLFRSLGVFGESGDRESGAKLGHSRILCLAFSNVVYVRLAARVEGIPTGWSSRDPSKGMDTRDYVQDVKEEISVQASDVPPQPSGAAPAVEPQIVPSIPDLPTTETTLSDPFLPVPTLMEDGLQIASEHISKGDMGMAAEEILKGMYGGRRDA